MSGKDCIREILISAYLDGELSGNDLFRVEEHLPVCRDCAAAYERMKADRNLLLECMPEANPPVHVKQQLFRKINAAPEIRGRAGILGWLGIGQVIPVRSKAWTAACASVVLFAVILSVFQYQRRLEGNRILAEIDRSKAEWIARDDSMNPFNRDAGKTPVRINAGNPFKSYLNER
jgi:anti-sigma factor RsiW